MSVREKIPQISVGIVTLALLAAACGGNEDGKSVTHDTLFPVTTVQGRSLTYLAHESDGMDPAQRTPVLAEIATKAGSALDAYLHHTQTLSPNRVQDYSGFIHNIQSSTVPAQTPANQLPAAACTVGKPQTFTIDTTVNNFYDLQIIDSGANGDLGIDAPMVDGFLMVTKPIGKTADRHQNPTQPIDGIDPALAGLVSLGDPGNNHMSFAIENVGNKGVYLTFGSVSLEGSAVNIAYAVC